MERKTVRYGFGGTLPTITNTITTTITITNDIRTIIDSFDAVIHMQECTVLNSASQAFLVRMQLTLHATHRTPHGASCLAQAMSAWPGETRCAPSRHCKDARVYGHTTTAMHDTPLPPCLLKLLASSSLTLISNFALLFFGPYQRTSSRSLDELESEYQHQYNESRLRHFQVMC